MDLFQKCKELYEKIRYFEYGIPVDGVIKPIPSAEYFVKNYHFLKPEEFEKYGGGICWDYVEYERKFLEVNDIDFNQYYLITNTPPNYDTHTFITVKDGDDLIYIESSFKRVEHIIDGVQKFKSLEDIIKLITTNMWYCNDNDKHFDEFRYDVCKFKGHPKYGCTCQEYMDWMDENSDIVIQDVTINPKKVNEDELAVEEFSVNKIDTKFNQFVCESVNDPEEYDEALHDHIDDEDDVYNESYIGEATVPSGYDNILVSNDEFFMEAKSSFKQDMRKVKVVDDRKAGTSKISRYKEIFKQYQKISNNFGGKTHKGIRDNDEFIFRNPKDVRKFFEGRFNEIEDWSSDDESDTTNQEIQRRFKNIVNIDLYEEAYNYLDKLVTDLFIESDKKNFDINRMKSLRNTICDITLSIPKSQVDQKNIIFEKDKDGIDIYWRPSSFRRLDMKKYHLFVHRSSINNLTEVKPNFIQFKRGNKKEFELSLFRDSVIHFWAFEKTNDPKKIARQIKDLNWGGHVFGNEFYIYQPKSTDQFYIDGNYQLAEDKGIDNDHEMWGAFQREMVPATIVTKRMLPVKKTTLEEIKKMIGYNKGDVAKYLTNKDIPNNWKRHDVAEMSEDINKEGPPSQTLQQALNRKALSQRLAALQNKKPSSDEKDYVEILDSSSSSRKPFKSTSSSDHDSSQTSSSIKNGNVAKSKENSNYGAPVQAISNNKLGSLLANKNKPVKESFESYDNDDLYMESSETEEKYDKNLNKIKTLKTAIDKIKDDETYKSLKAKKKSKKGLNEKEQKKLGELKALIKYYKGMKKNLQYELDDLEELDWVDEDDSPKKEEPKKDKKKDKKKTIKESHECLIMDNDEFFGLMK